MCPFPWTTRTGPDGFFRLGGMTEGEVSLIVLVPDGLDPPIVEEGIELACFRGHGQRARRGEIARLDGGPELLSHRCR